MKIEYKQLIQDYELYLNDDKFRDFLSGIIEKSIAKGVASHLVKIGAMEIRTEECIQGLEVKTFVSLPDTLCNDCLYFKEQFIANRSGNSVGMCEKHRKLFYGRDYCSYGRRSEEETNEGVSQD